MENEMTYLDEVKFYYRNLLGGLYRENPGIMKRLRVVKSGKM